MAGGRVGTRRYTRENMNKLTRRSLARLYLPTAG
jgi:hypothetical protein